MIYKNRMDVFEYEGKKYQIGATVKANWQSV